MGLSIHHLAMRTFNVPRLERFYVDVLGLPVLRRDDARGSVWLDAGAAVLMLERAEPGEPPVPALSAELVAFAMDEAVKQKDAWRIQLAEAAVAIECESAHTLYFRDPDGRRIGLSTFSFVHLPLKL